MPFKYHIRAFHKSMLLTSDDVSFFVHRKMMKIKRLFWEKYNLHFWSLNTVDERLYYLCFKSRRIFLFFFLVQTKDIWKSKGIKNFHPKFTKSSNKVKNNYEYVTNIQILEYLLICFLMFQDIVKETFLSPKLRIQKISFFGTEMHFLNH